MRVLRPWEGSTLAPSLSGKGVKDQRIDVSVYFPKSGIKRKSQANGSGGATLGHKSLQHLSDSL